MGILSYDSTLYFVKVPNISRNHSIKKGFTIDSFLSLPHKTLTNYAIVNDESFKCGLNFDEVMQYNYLIFRNNNAASIYWYCYIDDVDYINKEVCIVHYSIDSVTTFINSATFRKSNIVREHIARDIFGENREAEPLITDLIYKQHSHYEIDSDKYEYYLLATASASQGAGSVSRYVLNSSPFMGNVQFVGDENVGIPESAKSLIDGYFAEGTEDRIISIIKVPNEFFKIDPESKDVPYFDTDVYTTPADVDGYIPRNQKCYQYPYMRILVSAKNGLRGEYAYEDFENLGRAQFRIYGDTTLINDYITAVPLDHKGYLENFDESITRNGVVEISYGGAVGLTSKEKDILYQNIASSILGTAGAATSIPSALTVGASTGLNIGYEYYQLSKPSPTANNVGSNDLILNSPDIGFFGVYSETVTKEIMQTYDDFFEMYGYATNKVKMPNISGHTGYNFIQTKGCNVSIPTLQKYIDDFKTRFDAGITLWDSPASIGNYNI